MIVGQGIIHNYRRDSLQEKLGSLYTCCDGFTGDGEVLAG